ncbi:MAG: YebC/PmpR family DNA-binding transcriptional regulator [Planctomycetota bacterium]|nr:MAG: YebC/PmpR family DNA-binding transcriptional regulator [Planctomycetota bacterium]
MAGHSHWAGIKHRKAAQDKKRSKYFSKFSKAIMIAAKEGGGNPDKNLKLRYAIDKARAGNMPNASIERAIKKATGELGNVTFDEIVYEGYAPGGVAIIAEVVTDNRNRTAPEMRNLFNKHGGNLGSPGSVSFMFDKKGLIAVPRAAAGEDEVLEVALEAGAEDVTPGEEEFEIVTDPAEFEAVKEALKAKGWELTTAEIAWVPQTEVTPPSEHVSKVEAILEALEDHDDVQNVYSNYAPAQE